MSNKVLSLSGNQARVVSFYPKNWGEVDRFSHFYSTTYKFDERLAGILRGVAGHFHKAIILEELAHSLAPDLKKDREELSAKGHSSNKNGARLAAVVETIFCELYSSVDCARQVVGEIFHGYQGVPDSTRRFFQNADAGKLDSRLPEPIRNSFSKADWYHILRRLRDAVTHSDVGSCYFDESSGKTKYINTAIKEDAGKCLVIEDVFGQIAAFQNEINKFHGQIFRVLNQTLKNDEVFQICGFFGGRVYSRFVRPLDAINFNSGRCDALSWFEQEGNPRCPFADNCGAYKRAKEIQAA
jgi:hypothetical protein